MRQNMMLHALAACGDLVLAMFDFPENATRPPFPARVYPLPRPIPERPEGRWRRAFLDLFTSLPRGLRRADTELPRRIVRELEPASFDAVFAYRIDHAFLAGVLGLERLFLDVDDPEHVRHRAATQLEGHPRLDFRSERDLVKLREFERSAVATTAASFVCKHEDQAAFAPHLPIVVPNCVDLPSAIPHCSVTEPVLLFVGNLRALNAPNADGLLWFLEEIWPKVLHSCSAATLRIVGGVHDELAARFARHPRVDVSGFVNSLEECYAAASCSIAPIRYGTGTRIKILESMAHACPVVSTSKGCEGIAVEHGQTILIGDSANVFARGCVELLEDIELRRRMGDAARALIERQYSRQGQHELLVATLMNLIRGLRSVPQSPSAM